MTYRNATRRDRDTITGSMIKKFGEVPPFGFRGMRADRHTDTHHNTLLPPWLEITNKKLTSADAEIA